MVNSGVGYRCQKEMSKKEKKKTQNRVIKIINRIIYSRQTSGSGTAETKQDRISQAGGPEGGDHETPVREHRAVPGRVLRQLFEIKK